MSTRHYLFRKNNEKTRKEVEDCLVNEDFEKAKQIITEMDDGIHVGKSYSLNKWLFAVPTHQGKYYQNNRKSYLDFIRQCTESPDADYVLRDEYRRTETVADIEELIEISKNGYTKQTYFESHPEELRQCYNNPLADVVIRDDIRFIGHDF